MNQRKATLLSFVFLCIGTALTVPAAFAQHLRAGVEGAVFTMTNSTDPILGNEVVMYNRMADGSLALQGTFPTGGIGSGPAPTSTVFGVPIPATADGIGSQGSMLLSDDHRYLFVVNAGSNTISCFRNNRINLRLQNIVDSGGVYPASIAFRSISTGTGILYVLNSGGDGNVTGFRVSGNCVMIRIPGSSRSLAGTINDPPFPSPEPNEVLTTPADIEFSPDGSQLLVTIKGGPDPDPNDTSLPDGGIVVFPLNPFSGRIVGSPTVNAFNTDTNTGGPFSFLFDDNGNLVVNHANSFTVASYTLESSGVLTPIGDPVPISGLGDTSANLAFGGFNCWIALNNGIAYIMTFGAIPATSGGVADGPGVISALSLADDGSLSLLPVSDLGDQGVVAVLPQDDQNDSNAQLVGNHGIDLTVVNGDSGDFLYAIQPRVGEVRLWSINADGTLTDLGGFGDGLSTGVDPFAGTNPGINDFLDRCFLQPSGARSPECSQGSAQGIVGY